MINSDFKTKFVLFLKLAHVLKILSNTNPYTSNIIIELAISLSNFNLLILQTWDKSRLTSAVQRHQQMHVDGNVSFIAILSCFHSNSTFVLKNGKWVWEISQNPNE